MYVPNTKPIVKQTVHVQIMFAVEVEKQSDTKFVRAVAHDALGLLEQAADYRRIVLNSLVCDVATVIEGGLDG